MDAGPLPVSPTAVCRRCARPFTSGEVTGQGILRPRAIVHGGPFVEFQCPSCRTPHEFVPHGMGRYAPPGAPPPPPPSEAERQVPWVRKPPSRPSGSSTRPERDESPARPPPAASPGRAPSASPPPPPPPPPAEGPPTTVADALEILGVPAHASEEAIEDAYRAKALKVHPDKVAHLDAEFVALAERKFRRLQAARDLLLGPGA